MARKLTAEELEADEKFYDNFRTVQLSVPCITWDRETALRLFGPNFEQKTTPATIMKVKRSRKTGEPLFDLKFLHLKNQIFTNYDLDYVLMYSDEIPLKYHTLKAEFIVRKANEAAKSVSSTEAALQLLSDADVEEMARGGKITKTYL